jgi:RNA polymerase primary sigma factor
MPSAALLSPPPACASPSPPAVPFWVEAFPEHPVADRSSDGGTAAAEALPAYLREIGRVPLLDREAEAELFGAIEAGRIAAARLAEAVPLPGEESAELEAAVRRGALARARAVEANLRLVVSIARRHLNRGLDLEDLVQEGNLGLIRAVERFDPTLGFRFSTYATWWIRQAVGRAIMDRGRAIRLPVHLHEALGRVLRESNRLQQELGREPMLEELGPAAGLEPARVGELLRLLAPPLSLEAPAGKDGEAELADLIADPDAAAPEGAAEARDARAAIRAALGVLTPRERLALELRHGLADGRARSLAEVGAALGVTRERAHQLEAHALRKLRRPDVARRLLALAS